jgi:hypothetical protein
MRTRACGGGGGQETRGAPAARRGARKWEERKRVEGTTSAAKAPCLFFLNGGKNGDKTRVSNVPESRSKEALKRKKESD